MKKELKPLELIVDSQKAKLTHILKLKQLFRENSESKL